MPIKNGNVEWVRVWDSINGCTINYRYRSFVCSFCRYIPIWLYSIIASQSVMNELIGLTLLPLIHSFIHSSFFFYFFLFFQYLIYISRPLSVFSLVLCGKKTFHWNMKRLFWCEWHTMSFLSPFFNPSWFFTSVWLVDFADWISFSTAWDFQFEVSKFFF